MNDTGLKLSPGRSWRKNIARWRRSLTHKPDSQREIRQLVSASGLFDAQWYLERYPDVAQADLDPLDHFMTHGGREGRRAGPDFDCRWYSEKYPDVARSGLHPLVHYLRHGEGRQTTKRVGIRGLKTTPDDFAAASEILANRLFDAEWYAAENHLDTSGQATALHYLKIGGPAGLAASPLFDSAAYLRKYSDVREVGGNPLLHFIRHGSLEGRESIAVDTASAQIIAPYVRPSPKRSTKPEPEKAPDEWVIAVQLKADHAKSVVRLGDQPIGLLTEVYGVNTAPLPRNLSLALDDFCALRKLPRDTWLSARNGRKHRKVPDGVEALAVDQPSLVDGWFYNDTQIRLRIENTTGKDAAVRLIQSTADGTVHLVGEAFVAKGQPQFVDVAMRNVFEPVLAIYSTPSGDLSGGTLIAFPSLFRRGPHAAEADLYPDGNTSAAKREKLSRSLLRQTLGWSDAPAFEIGAIELDLRGATGSERIFSRQTSDWLSGLGVTIKAGSAAEETPTVVRDYLVGKLGGQSKATAPRTSNGALTLPCDAIPTLGAILSRRPSPKVGQIGSFVVCDSTTAKPLWMVSMPSMDHTLVDLQSSSGPLPFPVRQSSSDGPSVTSERTGLLAIRFNDLPERNDATLNFPVAPDFEASLLRKTLSKKARTTARISALILADDAIMANGMFESLATQTMADQLRLTVSVPDVHETQAAVEESLKRLFGDRYRIIVETRPSRPAALNRCFESADMIDDMVLLIDQSVVLQDRRTLETLYLAASRTKTASASCVIVRESGFSDGKKLAFSTGGIFPSHLSFQSSPALIFSTPETLGALPLATYPVAANDLGLAMIPASVWRDLSGLDVLNHPFDGYGLDFCIRAQRLGLVHLCTSVVTATDLGSTPTLLADPFGTDTLTISAWAMMFERTAILRVLD